MSNIGVAATFQVGTVEIPISADDIANVAKNGLQFALPPGQVIEVPDVNTFVTEFGKLIGVPALTIPALPVPFDKLTSVRLKITNLAINTKTGYLLISIGYEPDTPAEMPGPLSFIKLKRLGVSVIKDPSKDPSKK